MRNRFDLLVFDWDGTLFNSIDWIVESIQASAKSCSCPIPSIGLARSIIGLGLDDAMGRLFPDASASKTRELVVAYRRFYGARKMNADDLFDGVSTMLAALQNSGYLLAVATGKTRAGLQAALNSTGTQACFHATRCADETESKPDPTMLLQLIEELVVDRHRVLMIGDSVHDLAMAHNAGVASVAVTCGASEGSELQQFNPLLCLDETSQLTEILV